MSDRNRPVLFQRLLPPLAWMAFIFLMSGRSTVPKTPGISSEIAAAAGHVAVYGILAVLIARAILHRFDRFTVLAAVAWTVSVVYGISDEYHQSFVPGRYAGVEDVLFDAMGAAIGIGVYHLYVRQQTRSRARA
jgi:VanZ family protein